MSKTKISLNLFSSNWQTDFTDKKNETEFWNGRSKAYDIHQQNDSSIIIRQKLVEDIVNHLSISKSSKILDIGCGPGRHAHLFSRYADEVKAIDLSPDMIKLAKISSSKSESKPPEFEILDWETIDLKAKGWEKYFDLVIAARTPAINNHLSLEKMNQASKGHCLIISAADSINTARDPFKKQLNFSEEESRASRSAYYAFNLLWLTGYLPEIKYFDQSWEEDLPLKEAEQIYGRYYNMLHPLTESEQKALDNYLKTIAQNEIIHEKVVSKLILMIWEAKKFMAIDKK
jgi:SAM-dependent methyltransferase